MLLIDDYDYDEETLRLGVIEFTFRELFGCSIYFDGFKSSWFLRTFLELIVALLMTGTDYYYSCDNISTFIISSSNY